MRTSILSAALFLALPAASFAQDFDGDGVPDLADTLPCDGTASGLLFAPAEHEYGTILFEDLWPSRGDLDFNDVVLAHHYTLRTNAAGRVTGIRARFEPLAIGGSILNGLGLRLPVAKSAAASVTRVVNGVSTPLTAEQDEAQLTVVLSTDLRELFAGAPVGPVNSRSDAPRLAGQAIELEIGFATPVVLAVAAAPFDLYLFQTDHPSHEIHRPQYLGTSRFDAGLFGSADDGSTPGRSFVDSDGLPFAISIPALTVYPREGLEIATLFPNIVGFAASGGTTHQDFYRSTVVAASGYSGAGGSGPFTPAVVPMPVDLSCDVDADADGEHASTDCDDTRAVVHHGATEQCNGLDDDCDGAIDEGTAVYSTYSRDADGDGFGDGTSPVQACAAPPGYAIHISVRCSNGASGDCNVPGTTRIGSSAFFDATPPDGWVQCAGFVNTTGDDVAPNFLDNCLGSTALRIKVWTETGTLEEDVATTGMAALSAWPGRDYLGGSLVQTARTYWGSTNFFVNNNGRDACDFPAAPSGVTLGTGNGGVGLVAGGNSGADEYRVSCAGGASLPNRRIALYRAGSGRTTATLDCDDQVASVYPGRAEVCNGVDDDCNGLVDDGSGAPHRYHRDVDGDGFGNGTTFVDACTQPAGYVPYIHNLCSNGAGGDCNPAGTTLRGASSFVDAAPPSGWVQCAGFLNTDADDVSASFLNGCLGATGLRVRVWSPTGVLEEDVSNSGMSASMSAWPNWDYLGTNPVFGTRTRWGQTTFFTATDGRDACAQQSAPSGVTLGTGNGGVAIIAGGNTGASEYRVSCGGVSLPDRRVAVYRVGSPLAPVVDCNETVVGANPGAVEVCNGIDDDCDGLVDEGDAAPRVFQRDADGDGYGNGSNLVTACAAPPGYIPYLPRMCSNGSATDCNVAGTTRVASSAFVDLAPPEGWVQCAGFVNTSGDDVGPTFLDNCLNSTSFRVRVWGPSGTLEEDVSVTGATAAATWPSMNYLSGTFVASTRTSWGPSGFYTSTDGRDACGQQSAPSGTVINSGNGNSSAVAGGNSGADEYRISCGGAPLPDRRLAFYRQGTRSIADVDCNEGVATVNPAAADICNGIDDDCDGSTDENNPGGGAACGTGFAGACGPGTVQCIGGALMCRATVASAEICGSGGDEDCDGIVDESSCVQGCSNGSGSNCNVAGTTLISTSVWFDPAPPSGWTQCAGFINTAGNDVGPTFLNNCLNTTRLRLRVTDLNGVVEEDIAVTGMPSISAWPNWSYLGGTVTTYTRTRWGSTSFFTSTDGRDACAQQSAGSGTVFGTGNGSVAVIAGGNTDGSEYRVSCGGAALPNRRIALYR